LIDDENRVLTLSVASLKSIVLEYKAAVAKAPPMAPPLKAELSENEHPVKRVADDP